MSKGAGRNVSTCRSPCGDATGDLDGSRGLEDGESGEDAGESGQTDSDCAADKGCWGSYKGPAHRTWRLEPLREKGRPREGRWFRPSRGSLQQKKGSLPFVTARINPPSGSGSGSQGRSWIRHHRSGSFWALLVIRLVENPLHDGGGGRIKATACPFLSDHLFSFHVTAGVSGLHRPMRRLRRARASVTFFFVASAPSLAEVIAVPSSEHDPKCRARRNASPSPSPL